MIFFVHTAFVLMLSLERQKDTSIKGMFRTFYVRRAFRIYPLSWLAVMAVCAASIPPFPGESFHTPSLRILLANLTLTQNWVPFVLWGLSIAVLLLVRLKGVGLLAYVPCFLGGVVAYRLWRAPRLRLPPFLWVVAILVAIAMPLAFPLKFASWCASLLLGVAIPQFREFQNPLIRWPSAFVAKYSYGITISRRIRW